MVTIAIEFPHGVSGQKIADAVQNIAGDYIFLLSYYQGTKKISIECKGETVPWHLRILPNGQTWFLPENIFYTVDIKNQFCGTVEGEQPESGDERKKGPLTTAKEFAKKLKSEL